MLCHDLDLGAACGIAAMKGPQRAVGRAASEGGVRSQPVHDAASELIMQRANASGPRWRTGSGLNESDGIDETE